MKYRAEIDGLRSIAVLPVIFFHAGITIFSGGFVGVDVFFVISGFLITRIIIDELEKDKFSIVKFYERRARRILPAITFVTLVTSLFSWLLLSPDDYRRFSQSLVSVATFTSNIFFWLKVNYFNPAAEHNPMLHTWSLSVEEQYYIFFPLILMFFWRHLSHKTNYILIFIFILSFSAANIFVNTSPMSSFYLLHTRAWELMIGGLCATLLIKKGHQDFTKPYLADVGFLLILISIFTYDESLPAPSYYTLLPTFGTALLLIFCNPKSIVYKFLTARYMVGIGLISYSAYLWHQPVIVFARYYLTADGHLSNMTIAAIIVFVLGASFISWKYIEAPFRAPKIFNQRQIFKYSFIALIFILVIGLAGHFRIVKPQSQYLEDRYDSWPAYRNYLDTGPNALDQQHFVLYGDSLAIQYYGELQRQFGHGIQLTQPSCISLPYIQVIPPAAVYLSNENCFNRYQQLIEYIKTHEVDKIFWIQHWGASFLDRNTNKAIGKIEENKDLFIKAASELLSQIPKNVEVIVFSEAPSARTESNDMRYGYIRCKLFYNSTCPVEYPLENRGGQKVNAILSHLGKKYNNVKFFDLSKTLCSNETCKIIENDTLIYSDGVGHLTEFGVKVALENFNNAVLQ